MMQVNEWISTRLKEKGRVAMPIMTHPGIELCSNPVRRIVSGRWCDHYYGLDGGGGSFWF